MDKKQLLEAGYEIPDNSINLYNKGTEESSSFNENDESDASTKSSVDEWSDESTRLLLDKYAHYLELVGPMKKFKNKKIMWIQISKALEIVLGITILRRKCISEKNNSTSRSKRVKINFENEIKQIAAKDDSVEPEVLQSANKVILNAKNSNLPEASKIVKKKKVKDSLIKTLIEIKKQERHEEKMKLLKSYFEKENVHKDS